MRSSEITSAHLIQHGSLGTSDSAPEASGRIRAFSRFNIRA